MSKPTPIAKLGNRELYPDAIGENSVIEQVWHDLAATSERADPVLLGEFAHDTTRRSVGFIPLWELPPETIHEITDGTWKTLSTNTGSSADLGRAYGLARAISWHAHILDSANPEPIRDLWDARYRAAAQSIAKLLAETRALADCTPDLNAPGNIFEITGGLIHTRAIHFVFTPEVREPFVDDYVTIGLRGLTRVVDREARIKAFDAMQEAIRNEKSEDPTIWEQFGELDVVRFSMTGTKHVHRGPTGAALRDTFVPLFGWAESISFDSDDTE